MSGSKHASSPNWQLCAKVVNRKETSKASQSLEKVHNLSRLSMKMRE